MQLKLLMDRGKDREYFPEPAKSLFIEKNLEEKEEAKREFERTGLNINYVFGSRHLGDFLGPREELEEWMQLKVEAWDHGVCNLDKIANWYPQLAYAGLGISLQIEWQYLQRTVPEVGSLMGPIEDDLREAFLPALFGGEEVSANLR